MKKLSVALQIYSVREEAERDFVGTLAKIKALGYEGVELAGLYGLTAEQVRDAVQGAGLVPVSAHVPYEALVADLSGTIAQYKTIGCPYIAIPYLSDDLRPGNEAFLGVVDYIKVIGQACQAQGIQLLYHNHDFEFAKMPDGSYGLDYLYANVDAELLKTEIDTCWVKVAGEEPAAYVRKYAGRAPIVHLKDYVDEGEFEFRPVGHGCQDMPALLAASRDAGASWVVVEQDRSVGRPPMEAAKMSREYLATQGL